MNDQRYEFLVAAHEMIEAYLAIHAGVSPEAVDKFDRAYETKRKAGDDSEPGDDPKAPYHREHVFASKIERSLAKQLGVDWAKYDREVSSKCSSADGALTANKVAFLPCCLLPLWQQMNSSAPRQRRGSFFGESPDHDATRLSHRV